MGRGALAASASSDGGRTWSPRRSPSDAAGALVDQAFVDLSADEAGAFHAVRLDNRNGPDAGKGLRDARSTDGGATWSANATLDVRAAGPMIEPITSSGQSWAPRPTSAPAAEKTLTRIVINMRNRIPGLDLSASLALLLSAVGVTGATAQANHGPGTSGGGSSTLSGETLRQGTFDLSLRVDSTQFEDVDAEEAEERAADAGNFDGLDYAVVTTFSLSYGITEDLQAGARIGYYAANDFIDAEVEEGGTEADSSVGDPEGLTDLYLTLKYRFLKGRPGNLAGVVGIKLPTGKHDQQLASGETLEPSSQPGSGSVDYQLGVAYSRFLTSRATVDASALYTFRTEHDDFEVGDRFDAGVAVNYRLTESIKQFPQFSMFGEVLYVHLDKDDEDGEKQTNSGGDLVYLAPGVRVRFNENLSLTVAPAFPVVQDLNGDQIDAEFRASAMLSFTF